MADDVLGRKYLTGKGVYFPPVGEGDTGEGVTYGPPVQIACRFSEAETVMQGAGGTTRTFQSYALVDRDLEEKGVFVPTEFSRLVSRTAPFDNPGALRVERFSKIGNKRQTKFLRKAYF
jgi:hypothetical protein